MMFGYLVYNRKWRQILQGPGRSRLPSDQQVAYWMTALTVETNKVFATAFAATFQWYARQAR